MHDGWSFVLIQGCPRRAILSRLASSVTVDLPVLLVLGAAPRMHLALLLCAVCRRVGVVYTTGMWPITADIIRTLAVEAGLTLGAEVVNV